MDEVPAGAVDGAAPEHPARAARARTATSAPKDRPVLFSALRSEWDDLGERIEGLASLPNNLPELGGSGVPGLALGELRGQAAEGAPSRAAELTGLAQAATLDLLGETERAAAIVTRWLRPKPEPAAPGLGAAE